MSDFPERPETPRSRRAKEYEDPHYHDDDLVLPLPDDNQPPVTRHRRPQKPGRRIPPPRRHYEE